jgi:hypothetical protein
MSYIPCTKCGKKADLQKTRVDKTRDFKCRDKACGITFNMPPLPPPAPPSWR